jgi:carotenoid cleavage dioxygenase-like enzyme
MYLETIENNNTITVLGLPYLLDPATLETKGKDTLNGALNDSHCLAAHFRYDAATDRLVNFRFVVLHPCVVCVVCVQLAHEQFSASDEW